MSRPSNHHRTQARRRRPGRWVAPAMVSVIWLMLLAAAISRLRQFEGLMLALAGFCAAGLTFFAWQRMEFARWYRPIRDLSLALRSARKSGLSHPSDEFPSTLGFLAAEVIALYEAAQQAAMAAARVSLADPQPPATGALMTRSGLFTSPATGGTSAPNLQLSGDYSTTDMVNRLAPETWLWIESSPAEQEFLGWTLSELREKSFLDIVHPDDRGLAHETFLQALERGEALGLVLRIRNARGKLKSIEINAGARYGTNQRAMHLRCHVADITAKVRAERALRIRTRELTLANERLRLVNRELQALETELHDKNRWLAQANDELMRKNQELDEFAYVVSHDLQEPLRTLIAFSDFLLKDYGDRLDGEGQEFVRYLVDASRRMRAMILGMLTLSRAGKVIGDFHPVNLDDLAATIRTDLGELIRDKDAEVRIVSPLPVVWGDRDRLGQLLANLITNGLKYNESQRPVVEVRQVGTPSRSESSDQLVAPERQAVIAVQDNGIGIDPQFHASIFQLFRRLHTREEYEGTGAGLAICNKIVRAHGGSIWVESEPGRGATFFFRLNRPPTSPSDVPAPVEPEEQRTQVAADEHGSR
ncbi:MAG: sensor histidine kinase [Isosphaeraceae bacterium]